MVTGQNEPFEKAPPELMKQAEAFLKKHGDALDEEINFLERRGNNIDERGRLVRDVSEEGLPAKMKRMVAAVRDIARFGVVDKGPLIEGYRLLGMETRIARETAQHDYGLASRAQEIIRKKRDIPDFLPLGDDDKRAARKFRRVRMEFSHEMEAVADTMMGIQSDLIDLMKALGINTRAIKPPGGYERM